jgi:putative two-component system response regulator
VLSLVGEHHERLDGAGYPAGLTAEQLAIGPRILAACDVYDALVSDRVYSEAWSTERALGLLREQAGAAFDPRCVEALAAVVAPAPASARAVAAAPAVGVPAIRTA